MDLFLIMLGAALLYVGGEVLVKNATRLARAAGVSPLTVGLTVVAFCTSSPELVTTLAAALEGSPDTALGNVVGSNSANLGLVLGLTALLYPLRTRVRFLRREVPFMIGTGVLLLLLVGSGILGRLSGALLLSLLGLYLLVLLRSGDHAEAEGEPAGEENEAGTVKTWRTLAGVALGIGLLVGGAHILIEGAVSLAHAFDVPERVIGLTLVAFGGSLPELAGSLVAAFKREGDLILGNLIGSNVFNVLFVLGATAAVRPLAVSAEAFLPDLLVMLGLSLLVLLFLITGRRLGRREALILVGAYATYVVLLFG
jgi:cation:H+ antiporter